MGLDETFELGEGKSRPEVARRGRFPGAFPFGLTDDFIRRGIQIEYDLANENCYT